MVIFALLDPDPDPLGDLYNKWCSPLGPVRYTIATILRPEREGLTLSVAKPVIIKVIARINTEIKKVQVSKKKQV